MDSTTVSLNDFDITYYPGLTAQDVIPELIKNLKIAFSNLPYNSIQYKAIKTYIRLLKNYLAISDTFSRQTTETISIFNNLSQHLMDYVKQKYPQYDIYISPQGRIKSPISANIKIKEKIAKYMKDNKDLDTLTITDFIAFRFIIDVRDGYGNLASENISVDICYDIINEAIQFINSCPSTTLLSLSEESKPKSNFNIPTNIYHPVERPKYIEENDKYIKDFIYSPKPNTNYQSAHLKLGFTIPNFSDTILGELQFRTFLMNEYAERGPASHTIYKTRQKISYLAIPQILMPINQYSAQIDFIKPDEAFEKFLGFSPKQINPFMSYEFLRSFLEESNYTLPVLPLYFKQDDSKNISIYDDFRTIHTMPVEVMGSSNSKELVALVSNLFDEKIIEKELEHEFI